VRNVFPLFRTWLYRIATNACLDFLDSRPRQPRRQPREPGRPAGAAGAAEVPWLQPYPDRLLDQVAAGVPGPEAMAVSKETIELAFLVAIQNLPARQRAVLILRDVLGWPAAETATTLEVSVAAVKSALQRARATLRARLPRRREQWVADHPSDRERAVLGRYVAAHERGDAILLAALLAEDARLTMPPAPTWYAGRDAIVAAVSAAAFTPAFGGLRLVPTGANRQPAAAFHVRRPGDAEFRAFAVDVLRVARWPAPSPTREPGSFWPDAPSPPWTRSPTRSAPPGAWPTRPGSTPSTRRPSTPTPTRSLQPLAGSTCRSAP
jgi:RNA polymerase sigma-70 factor (ECF subfamily)